MKSNETGNDPSLTLQEGVKYEVAEDLFGDLIGWCAAQIAEEKRKDAPDVVRVQELTDRARGYVAERKALNPQNREAVNAVLAKYAPLVHDLRPGRGGSEGA